MLALSASWAAMSFGWDSSVIGGVIEFDEFKIDYGLGVGSVAASEAKANLAGNIVSTLQCGCLLGALIASPITDKYGRRWCLIATSITINAGIVLQAASTGNLGAMYAGRFISGVGVGSASVINPLYVSENAPRAVRGFLTGLYQLFIVTGGMIAFWINYGANRHLSGRTKYIVPLTVQALPAVLLFICMFLNPESPRWLARRDRWEESKRILSRLRSLPEDHPYIQEEFQEIVDQLEHEKQLVGDATFKNLQKEMWTIPGNRNRALISIFLMIMQQMTGVNAVNTYAPTIFKNLGLSGTDVSLFSTGIYGVVKVTSCIVFLTMLADSLGRRRSLLGSSVALAATMYYIGIYLRVSPPKENDDFVPPAGYVALVCIFLYAASFQFGWGPACWILASEIPTARLRSMNVSYAAATQWLFNLIISRTLPNMLNSMGDSGYGTYFLFASFCVVMFFFVWFFVPETKGISLERMDELFGLTSRDQKSGGSDDGGEKGAPEVNVVNIENKENAQNKV